MPSKIPKRKLRQPVSGLFLSMATFAGPACSPAPMDLCWSKPLQEASASRTGVSCTSGMFIFLSRCFAATEIFLHVCFSGVYDLSWALLPCFLRDADSCLCCLLQSAHPPKNPTRLDTLLWPHLVQGFCPLPSPWSLCHSRLLPPGLICCFNSSSQPSYPVSAPRGTYQNRRSQLFPLRGWEEKATLGMPSWGGDFGVLLYQGVSTRGMGISHRRPVKRALKRPGSCAAACLALVEG